MAYAIASAGGLDVNGIINRVRGTLGKLTGEKGLALCYAVRKILPLGQKERTPEVMRIAAEFGISNEECVAVVQFEEELVPVMKTPRAT